MSTLPELTQRYTDEIRNKHHKTYSVKHSWPQANRHRKKLADKIIPPVSKRLFKLQMNKAREFMKSKAEA